MDLNLPHYFHAEQRIKLDCIQIGLSDSFTFFITCLEAKPQLFSSSNEDLRISGTQVKCGFHASWPAKATKCTMQTHLWQYLCGVRSLSVCLCLSDYQSTIFIKIIK